MKYFSLFLVVLIAFQSSTSTHYQVVPPNIIFILMDDLGLEEIQPYNALARPCPNLKRMAQEGVTFTQHYAGTSVCAPSRCVLMTGKHTGHCEVRGNIQMEPHGQMPISEQTVTVAELLKKANYHTALIGKWGLGIEGSSGEPTRQGFDRYYGYLDQVLAHNAFPAYLLRNGQKEYLNNQVVWDKPDSNFKGLGSYATEKKEYANDLFTNEALTYIDQNRDRPFFLYLTYTIPHNNGEAPFEQRFESSAITLEDSTRNWTETERQYAASLKKMDGYIGQIMQKLESSGLAENTIVFFSSDNGSTEDIPKRFAVHNRLKGFKRSPYEGGIRAPLLVWWKNKLKAGSKIPAFSGFWDFLPTACDLAKVSTPADCDGRSMLPLLLRSNPRKQAFPTQGYWEFHEQGGWQAYRNQQYKLIYWHKKQQYELYDLSKDPGEQQNLADQAPAVVDRLKSQLQQERQASSHFNFGKK